MSTDTRYPQYDDATLQAVMDDACQETHTKHPEVGGTILLASDFNTVAWPAEKPARLALARGLLARLPEPTPPTADGKTPGLVAFEAWGNEPDEWHKSLCSNWQASASAVLAAFGGAGLEAAIARMEAVPLGELMRVYCEGPKGMEAGCGQVRARLIAAAREGHGPAAVDWKAKYEDAAKERDELLLSEYLYKRVTDALGIEKDILGHVKKIEARAEKAEAELAMSEAAFSNYRGLILSTLNEVGAPTHHPDVGASARKPMTPQERIKALCGLSTLPPEAKAPAVEVDPYAELKAAHAEGKVIQWHNGHMWHDLSYSENPLWIHPAKDYRIKPATTFTAHGKTWNVHVPGDPMPCDENRAVEVITQKAINEKNWFSCPHDSSYWEWNHGTKITGWRYADEPTPAEPVKPWTPAVGDVVTLKSGGPKMTVVSIKDSEGHVVWFQAGTPRECDFHVATIIPA